MTVRVELLSARCGSCGEQALSWSLREDGAPIGTCDCGDAVHGSVEDHELVLAVALDIQRRYLSLLAAVLAAVLATLPDED